MLFCSGWCPFVPEINYLRGNSKTENYVRLSFQLSNYIVYHVTLHKIANTEESLSLLTLQPNQTNFKLLEKKIKIMPVK